MTSNQTNQTNQTNAERQAAEFTASTNLWRAALRMEGLTEAVSLTEDEIDMVSRAMSILAQEGIDKGLSDEEYAEYLLEQVE